ncbi:ribosomal protein L2 [Clostridium tetanomorphum]|uniref:Uncharacterized protein n=1 Tax=Clostridium tetanomorphum TaxID=1553 RepID=A0A923EDL5_CLOTT|nr:hypothetical protein [Clostridium tetanomorphum]KAJ49469.1 hypothetical protein CTM_22901 [Clostridium tetanomorphum DSM 665]KAJ53044.1 hypothetical protein CTM_04610 [Clostridium tetanomorphum DSM 665]MBC2400177.1 hypothetical protein [Clostridium tetanomorphum]MBP1866571.1 ribosomal protein L2 [Clostridium tetanomorphum]NRS86684.1 ribosomal protein L2 [Clostridium tetanomorphum]
MAIKDSITMGISKIAKTVGDGAATVAKKSGEFVEISKLNLNISTEKENIDKLYQKIGEIVYDKYKNGEIIDVELEESCRSIVDANERIESIEEKIKAIKSKKEESTDEDLKEESCTQCGCGNLEDEIVENCEGSSCNFQEPNKEDDLMK